MALLNGWQSRSLAGPKAATISRLQRPESVGKTARVASYAEGELSGIVSKTKPVEGIVVSPLNRESVFQGDRSLLLG